MKANDQVPPPPGKVTHGFDCPGQSSRSGLVATDTQRWPKSRHEPGKSGDCRFKEVLGRLRPHLNWRLVRAVEELQILTRASYVMLIVFPILATLWPGVRSIINAYDKIESSSLEDITEIETRITAIRGMILGISENLGVSDPRIIKISNLFSETEDRIKKNEVRLTTIGGTTGTSGGTTGTTGETTGSSTATCTPGNHGLVRGRPHVANGTLVADDGCPLRGVHTHTIPQTYFSQWYGSLSWWQNLHDIGHFNLVSAGGYLAKWNNSGDPGQLQTVEGEEAVLDQMVSLAAQSGMYVNIVFDAFNGSDYWSSANTFWNAIASRYANNTNVTYEIVNEPELFDSATGAKGVLWVIRKIRQKLFSEGANDIPGQMQSLYNLIRSKAPNTPIIAWSFSYVTDTDNKLSIISQANGIDYSNAVVGYHGYGATTVGPVASAALQIQGAGYPMIMTEVDPEVSTGCGCSVGFPYILKLESEEISWFWLDGDGFCDADNGVAYGNCTNPISVTWPKD